MSVQSFNWLESSFEPLHRIHVKVNPFSQNRALVDRILSIVKLGRFRQFWCQRTQKIWENL